MAFIQLDGTSIWINNSTQDTFYADLSGNVTLRGTIYANAGLIGGWTIFPDILSGSGMIEGGMIRSSTFRAAGSRYIIMDNDGLKSYNAWNQVEGIVLDKKVYNV